MGTRESSAPSPQVIYEGGSVGMEFVCDRVAESEKTMCISGNNSDGIVHLSPSSIPSVTCIDPIHVLHCSLSTVLQAEVRTRQTRVINLTEAGKRNDFQCLEFLDFGVNVLEIHLNVGSLNITNEEWKEEDWPIGKLLGCEEHADSKNVGNYKQPRRFLRAKLPRSHAIYGGFLGKLRNLRKNSKRKYDTR
ncbi:hypothetical protein DVH24_021518 [Malus domestica]|uniref:Uncharacterized protein n=1 Tax=Malus domestica TaxID=3750 RepID=A0A498JX74_MALDO|nr:hypothetical protein DVH24_021518 [Malus domestica]